MGIKEKLEFIRRTINNRMLTPTEKFDLIKDECNSEPIKRTNTTLKSMKEIEVAILKHFLITDEQLQSKTHKHEIVIARQLAHYLSVKYTNETLSSIGRYFGRKSHCTVLWSVSQIANYMEKDKRFYLIHSEFIEQFKN